MLIEEYLHSFDDREAVFIGVFDRVENEIKRRGNIIIKKLHL